MKRLVVFSMVAVLLNGCTEVEKFWDKEFVGVYAPGMQKEKDTARLAESLNFFLGKSKNERIRVIGPPNSCTRASTGEETCEWTPKASSSPQHIAYGYDKDSIARAWSYQGPLGQFTNANYQQAPSATSSIPQSGR